MQEEKNENEIYAEKRISESPLQFTHLKKAEVDVQTRSIPNPSSSEGNKSS